MNKICRLTMIALTLALFALVACDSKTESDSDCDTAKEEYGPGGIFGTANLGESCVRESYGSCDKFYSNCAEGVCVFNDSTYESVCTLACSGQGDCGSWYCKDGYCQPPCESHWYNDGYMSCLYEPSEDDPTQCVQTTCYY